MATFVVASTFHWAGLQEKYACACFGNGIQGQVGVLIGSTTKAPFGRASLAASGAAWSRFLPNEVK